MDWVRWQNRWPNAAHSEFVQIDRLTWHVQKAGEGPVVLLLHGAGASSHSMTPLCDRLRDDHTTVAVDLPGHGFTDQPDKKRLGLEAMSSDLSVFLQKQSLIPDKIIAHSASASIALRMCLDEPAYANTKVVSINGALGNFRGLAGTLFPLFAKMLAANQFTARIFSSMGQSRSRVESVLASTGSTVPADSLNCYHALMSDADHVGNTLTMMANWSLDKLLLELPKVKNQVHLIAGDKDLAVPPDTADIVSKKIPGATVTHVSQFGHLIHEEDPDETVRLIRNAFTTSREEC